MSTTNENAVHVAEKLAKYSLGLNYDELSEKVVHEAKRALLDTLGVTFAAKGADAVKIMWKVLDNFNVNGTATIIGSGKKTLPQYAALANGCMTRYWDYNDGYGFPMGKMVAASHPYLPFSWRVREHQRQRADCRYCTWI